MGALWSRQEILLLLSLVQLTLLTVVGWLISRKLGCHTRFQLKMAQRQVELAHAAATYGARGEEPQTTVRRLATNATRRAIGELMPLRGSVAPTYLLFREEDTRRRLLLAAEGDLRAALRAEGVRRSLWPWRRPRVYALSAFNSGALVLEEIEDAWAALAERLCLPAVIPATRRWLLVELPPEELIP